MKRMITLLLAAMLALGLLGCGKSAQPEKTDTKNGIDVTRLIRHIEAFQFPVDEEFADKSITRFKLSQALQAAAENGLSDAQGKDAGLAPDKDGFWRRTYHVESRLGGEDEGEMWLELTCGLTENVVRITAYKGARYGLLYAQAPELYTLLRHQGDRNMTVNQEIYERYQERIDTAIQAVYQDQVDNGQPFTGWELTRLEFLRSYTDETDNSTINIYAVEYAMLTDRPDKVWWKEGMTLDSQARVENVGDIGRLATRYWWWGEKWESAILGKTPAADELAEARTALKENNPRT